MGGEVKTVGALTMNLITLETLQDLKFQLWLVKSTCVRHTIVGGTCIISTCVISISVGNTHVSSLMLGLNEHKLILILPCLLMKS